MKKYLNDFKFMRLYNLILSRKKILIVDDELDICIMLKVVLESNGFIANYYSNPIVALDEFKSNFYDLIILDIQMSEINGMQFYREIRKRDKEVKICFFDRKSSYI